jgi:hypothetical protein
MYPQKACGTPSPTNSACQCLQRGMRPCEIRHFTPGLPLYCDSGVTSRYRRGGPFPVKYTIRMQRASHREGRAVAEWQSAEFLAGHLSTVRLPRSPPLSDTPFTPGLPLGFRGKQPVLKGCRPLAALPVRHAVYVPCVSDREGGVCE